ncbi:hypothetical protein [Streptomyces sp. 2A115]|uniref:hypothetical protein n=1 Tax=Streptomyces sp. 2A115 TaxID=3457439 RepID=UPI003FD333F9
MRSSHGAGDLTGVRLRGHRAVSTASGPVEFVLARGDAKPARRLPLGARLRVRKFRAEGRSRRQGMQFLLGSPSPP